MLGKTGAGKSSVLRYLVEHLLANQKRVCIVDPKGDHWGLKSSADGKSEGYPVIAFGDFKEESAQDVPINDQSGKHVAELIASGNRPCIIGFRGWMPGAMTKFWIDFASALFNANSGELYLVGDEFHNFAPKGKIMDPQAGKCLHWSNRLLSEGRGLGIVCLIASQRPQKVHNDTLTSCESLIAMRVIHKADRDAVKAWIDGCGDGSHGSDVLNSLANLARGEAWVWSPEIKFGPERIKFPMFKTFDSFAPPQLQNRISKKSWADVDLDEVKGKLAAVIEEHKANDPKELKKANADLQRQLREAESAKPSPAKTETKTVEKHVVTMKQIAAAERVAEKLDVTVVKIGALNAELQSRIADAKALADEASVASKAINAAVATAKNPDRPVASVFHNANARASAARIIQTPRPRAEASGNGDSTIGNSGLRRILIALAQRNGLTNGQIGVRANLSSTTGTFSTYMSKARSNGWITDQGEQRLITDEGIAALGSYTPLPTGQDLLRHWLSHLGSSGAARILSALAEAYPNTLTNEEIGAAANLEPTTGTFSTYMSKLRTLELIEGRGQVKASDELFS